ncbi:hypothetical protein Q4595_11315 [Wenyingzhuangia sp. 1_MG-2023]|nr:hypothetical protein [Wenyingzhuangia sp. 1_MG-2023]
MSKNRHFRNDIIDDNICHMKASLLTYKSKIMSLKQIIEEEIQYLKKTSTSEVLYVFYANETEPSIYKRTFDQVQYISCANDSIVIFDKHCKTEQVVAVFTLNPQCKDPSIEVINEYRSIFKSMVRKKMHAKNKYKLIAIERD